MSPDRTLTADRVRDVLDYDPATGWLTWRFPAPGRACGSRAGCSTATGYRKIRIDNVLYQEHRVAWLHVYGQFPERDLDHINGDGRDNRVENLRECTSAQNHQNRHRSSLNTSGYLGVSWHKQKNRWRATIVVNGRQTHLGLFDTAAEAGAAYHVAKARFHPFAADTYSPRPIPHPTT